MAYYNENNVYDNGEKRSYSGNASMVRIFGYMAIGLLITGLVAFGLGYLFYRLYPGQITIGKIPNSLLAITIVAAILLIVMSVVMTFVVLKGQHSLVLPAIIYAALYGVLFAPISLLIDWRLIGMAFGATAAVFLLMTLIAFLSKGNLGALGIVVIGLIGGVAMMSGLSLLFILIQPNVARWMIWTTNFVIFAVIMLVTIIDISNIKQITANAETSTNLELFCAITLYTDFIAIFIRILYYLSIIYRNNN